jgi:glycerophosphoryl diester phosphodiesterase
VELVLELSAASGRPVGIYPELKHPSYFAAIGLSLEKRLVQVLHASGYRERSDPIFIQSFEVGALRRLRSLTRLQLVQLIAGEGAPFDRSGGASPQSYEEMVTPKGLAEIATYADGIGPAKSLILPRDRDQKLLPATSLVADAHRHGLVVHPWTFRSENHFLPSDMRRGTDARAHGDAAAEYRRFIELGVDGVFTDFPAHAVAAQSRPLTEAELEPGP